MERQKELQYAKALQKDSAEGLSTPFHVDVLAQLANISARITFYELLRPSKSTREALREALADSEAFIAQILAEYEEEAKGHCLQTSKRFSCITFTPDDMQIKGKQERPLHYTGYIGSFEVSRIQVAPECALNIMPRRVMQHLGIPTHRLSIT